MDAEKYRQVWIIKYEDDSDKDPNRTVDNEDVAKYDSDDDVYDQPTAAYREDLAKHKLVWTGNFWPDMWFYTKQEHNLLSVCLSTKVHPLGRWERFFIELFIFALASMWAASITLYLMTIRIDQDSIYDSFTNFAAYYGYSILGGLVKTMTNSILKWVATCTCYQQENTRARVKAELAGYICMAIWGVISAGLFGLGLYFVWKGGKEIGEPLWWPWMVSLIITYIAGWCISFILIFLIFMFLYAPCMKYDYIFKFDVTYQDYLNWYDEHGEDDEVDENAGSALRDSLYVPLRNKSVEAYNM